MQAVLAVTVPFFALVLAGWLAAWRGLLPVSAVPGLNAYVLYFALPCLLLRFGIGTPVRELLNPVLLALYLLCALLIVEFTIRVSLSPRVGLKDASFGALVAAFPNSGFMGVPLLVGLLDPAAAGPVICTLLADMLVTSSLCIALSQLQDAHDPPPAAGQGAGQAALRALRGALANSLPWAIGLDALLSASGVALTGPPLAGGLQALAPLFVAIDRALVDKLRGEAHWHADETRWAVFVTREGKVSIIDPA